MVLATTKENLCLAKYNITAASLYAKFLKGDDIMFISRVDSWATPCMFSKLRQTRFGLKQAPHYFCRYLSAYLEHQDLVVSKHDPSFFLSKEITVIIYFDELLVYGHTDKAIGNFIKWMKKEDGIIVPTILYDNRSRHVS